MFVQRINGAIVGAFANPQPDYAEEELADDSAELMNFLSPAPTLDDIKTAQIALIDEAYFAAIQVSVSFETAAGVEKVFQADNVGENSSQNVLLKAFTGYSIVGAVPASFTWRSQDNVNVPFTLADLGGLYIAMLAQGDPAFRKRTSLKDQINAIKVKSGVTEAQAIAAVQAITWQ